MIRARWMVGACGVLLSSSCAHPGPGSGPGASGTTKLPVAPPMPNGRRFSPEEGGFEVLLPAAADEPARVVEGDNHLSYEASTSVARYEIQVIHAPGGIANPGPFLARMRARVAESGTVLSDEDRTQDEHGGWSMQLADLADPRAARARVDMLLAPRHAFLLMVSSDDEQAVDAPEARQFFESFTPRQTTGLTREIRSTEAMFEAVFPPACGPAFKRLEVVDDKVHISWVSEASQSAQCMASVVRVDAVPAEQALDAAAEGAVAALPGASVDARSNSEARGAPRRTIRLHGTVDGTTLYMRVDFIHGDRAVYQLQYVTPDPAELDAVDVHAYFESFRLRDGEAR